MKKLVTILLIVTLTFSLSISAFATYGDIYYDGELMPTLPEPSNADAVYITLAKSQSPPVSTYAIFTVYPPTINGSSQLTISSGNRLIQYKLTNGVWDYVRSHADGAAYNFSTSFMTNYDLYYSNGNIYQAANIVEETLECDGTACPATDPDHDNICNDCGNVLTFSLRSTLLDYAKTLAETNSAFSTTHKYYAVVQHPTDSDKYVLYISQILMGSTDGETVTGGDMYRCIVVTRDDGSFANQGFGQVDSWSGSVVYANHTIPNFFPVPLAVTIQGVTEEQMKVTLPNLMEVFLTLTRCGIGLLTLLILLPLLYKKFRMFTM